MEEIYHSVRLDNNKCKGCTKCLTKCPVEAVRIKNSKAVIYNEKCIDCGECIRVCPYGAHSAIKEQIGIIKNYKIKVCIPSVTIYSQFDSYVNPDVINESIKSLGFDEVYDTTYACDIVSKIIKKEIEKTPKPAISNYCPSIIRLIENMYPSLLDHVIKVMTPIEVAASLIREKYKMIGYNDDDIGVFYLSPCASWSTKIRNDLKNSAYKINGTIAINDVYIDLLKYIRKQKNKDDSTSLSYTGIEWSICGGQISSMEFLNSIKVDGTENVIKVFNDIERGAIQNINYIEANACNTGCTGGILLINNPYNAKKVIENYRSYINFNNRLNNEIKDNGKIDYIMSSHEVKSYNIKLGDDFESAVKKMKYMNNIINALPKTDCGQCGSPSCRAFAEDVVRGLSKLEDCKYIQK